MVTLPHGIVTARTIIEAVVQVLPEGWQLTRLAGRLIAYKETKGSTNDAGEMASGYPSAIEWWRSHGSEEPLHHVVREV